MICPGCTRPSHPAEACIDAVHPHQLYRSCCCAHRPQPAPQPPEPAPAGEKAEDEAQAAPGESVSPVRASAPADDTRLASDRAPRHGR